MRGSKLLQLLTQRIAVEALVSHYHQALRRFEQRDDVFALVSLAFDEQQLHWQAVTVGQRHDLGIASATRAAHCLLLGSSGGIGGALVHHHMRAIDQSDPAFGADRQSAQQSLPDALPGQSLIPAIDRAPGAEAIGQVSPRPCISQAKEQCIKHHVQFCWRSAAQLQGTIFLSRSLSGPHHVKRCVFIDFTLYSTTTVLPINRFSNTT
jgi:hypothetical protein